MSYELGDPDDRCCDEGREADTICGHHWGNR
jgi:hypothetical protein